MRPRLWCKCLGTGKYTAKPSQRQDWGDRGGKFYLVEFAVQLRLRLIFESAARPSAPANTSLVFQRPCHLGHEILLSRICKDFGFRKRINRKLTRTFHWGGTLLGSVRRNFVPRSLLPKAHVNICKFQVNTGSTKSHFNFCNKSSRRSQRRMQLPSLLRFT